jgi:hypothetical protein
MVPKKNSLKLVVWRNNQWRRCRVVTSRPCAVTDIFFTAISHPYLCLWNLVYKIMNIPVNCVENHKNSYPDWNFGVLHDGQLKKNHLGVTVLFQRKWHSITHVQTANDDKKCNFSGLNVTICKTSRMSRPKRASLNVTLHAHFLSTALHCFSITVFDMTNAGRVTMQKPRQPYVHM